MILGRSIAGVLAGAVPLPFLDDWLIRRILGAAYRKIAAAHRVDLEDASIEKLVHGRTSPRRGPRSRAARSPTGWRPTAWKRLLLALTTVRRRGRPRATFVVMTLFEHYCAKLHVGLALDAPTALAVRDTIVAAMEQTPGGLSFEPFRRGARRPRARPCARRSSSPTSCRAAGCASCSSATAEVAEPERSPRSSRRSTRRSPTRARSSPGRDRGRAPAVVRGQPVPRRRDLAVRRPRRQADGAAAVGAEP